MPEPKLFTISQPIEVDAGGAFSATFYDVLLLPGTIYVALEIGEDSIIVGRSDSIAESYFLCVNTPEEWAQINFESESYPLSQLLKQQQQC